jgi:hypothetical protein
MMFQLLLKRASASRPSGEWNDDDYDVLADGNRGRPHHEGGGSAGGAVLDVDARLRAPRRPHADARLRGNPRGRDGGFCQELAARSEGARIAWSLHALARAISVVAAAALEDILATAC